VTLPSPTLEKLDQGRELSRDEQTMVERAPEVAEKLLANIPRLEAVRAILAAFVKPSHPLRGSSSTDGKQALVKTGAELLRVAVDFDTLELATTSATSAIDTMRGREGKYSRQVLDALTTLRGGEAPRHEIREISASTLRVGMVFASDVRTRDGVLLVCRGYEITESFLARVRNHPGNLVEPLRVIVRPT
jgi:hypothetical protein